MIETLNFHIIKNFLKDAVKVQFCKYPRIDPLMLAYFVTFQCNCHCSYCGYPKRNFKARYRDVTTADAKRIMEICREAVPGIAFSGGEPLIREDIVEIVKHAKELRYKPISLFTNSLLLPQREEILDYVDFLQISLDTLDEKKQDQLNGRIGVGKTVKRHIRTYALLQKEKKFRINMNCVIGAFNLDEIPDIIGFAVENKVRLSICPQLEYNGVPVHELVSGEVGKKYRTVIGMIVEAKAKTNVVLDIQPFLEHVRDFRNYRCYPFVSARVYPDGSFIYPCTNLCDHSTNVLAAGSWKTLMKSAKKNRRTCTQPCFLPCYLETSLLIRHPLSLIREAVRR